MGTKGFKLLKKKRDALKARMQEIMKEIIAAKVKAGQALKDAAFTTAKSHWAAAGDDFASAVIEAARQPSMTIKLTGDSVAGVAIPSFKLLHDPAKEATAETLGVGHGGAVIQANRKIHQHAVKILVSLASLQTAFKTVDEEIKMTSRRVNALEYVLIPKIEDIIAVMIQEMDEQAREEFFRVKKVVQKKKQKKDKEKEAELAAAMDAPSAVENGKDPDIMF